MALAKMSLARAIASETQLFNFLIRSTTIFTRSLHTNDPSSSDSDTTTESDTTTTESETDWVTDLSTHSYYNVDKHGNIDRSLLNPFIEEGPRLPYELKDKEDAIYARVDLPGVPKEGLKMWVKDDFIHVRGVEVKKAAVYSEEEPPRKYFFNIDLPKNEYRVEDIRAVMEFGVLRILVPKTKPEETEGVFMVKVD